MFNKLIEKEYHVSNGIGGFSSASLAGANTRKYHSVLNASLNPPVNRHVLLSRIVNHVTTEEKTYTLESTEHTNKILDNTNHLIQFDDMPLPTFTYKINDITIIKQIAMQYGYNTAVVQYTIITGDHPALFGSDLHVNDRNHHDLSKMDDFSYKVKKDQLTLKLKGQTAFNIQGFGTYLPINEWADEELYRVESRRGQDDIDRNFILGSYQLSIPSHTSLSFGIIASTEEIQTTPSEIIDNEISRRHALCPIGDETMKRLFIGCDQFIVERKSTNSKTVIAGYPWFTDWGRDTMIALPGLTLSTERFSDAKDIIHTFIKYEKDGLIPNMFPDDNIEPMYNTIDGTLWLFIAIFQYYKETLDQDFIKSIWPTLTRIIDKHVHGTVYDIHVDEDGLLSGGDPTTQLTWMDVKIDGIVVTPRHGKAVEINALFYNALRIMAFFSDSLKLHPENDYMSFANDLSNSFNEKFWNPEKNCLYDLIQDGKPVDRIRPNQIFAVSLPFRLLNDEREKQVVECVEEYLLTPLGLRSLSQDHPDYKSYYGGDVYKRDFAYHQGTAWGWLMGPYLEAHYKVHKDKSYLEEKLKGMIEHLDETGIGGISEVFSGDSPHESRGCYTQAWSVSELTRLYKLLKTL